MQDIDKVNSKISDLISQISLKIQEIETQSKNVNQELGKLNPASSDHLDKLRKVKDSLRAAQSRLTKA
jgi:vacuolar-type H+-ATPase subunit I/STV1